MHLQWGSNLFGHVKKRKRDLLAELAALEQLEEGGDLSPEDVVRKTSISVELFHTYADEESYWHQWSHARWLLQGD